MVCLIVLAVALAAKTQAPALLPPPLVRLEGFFFSHPVHHGAIVAIVRRQVPEMCQDGVNQKAARRPSLQSSRAFRDKKFRLLTHKSEVERSINMSVT
jgi:hypothetical protein